MYTLEHWKHDKLMKKPIVNNGKWIRYLKMSITPHNNMSYMAYNEDNGSKTGVKTPYLPLFKNIFFMKLHKNFKMSMCSIIL